MRLAESEDLFPAREEERLEVELVRVEHPLGFEGSADERLVDAFRAQQAPNHVDLFGGEVEVPLRRGGGSVGRAATQELDASMSRQSPRRDLVKGEVLFPPGERLGVVTNVV